MDLGDRKELSPSANLTLISVLDQWDPSFFRGCGKLIQLHSRYPALEQVSANRYVTMVIYQKLLPRTKKRGVFYLSLEISSLNRLASYDEYPPDPYPAQAHVTLQKFLKVGCTMTEKVNERC